MWMTTEDARSDFILAAAAALFGPIVESFLLRLPGYPDSGTLGLVLRIVWLFVMTGLVPLLLARYRDQTFAAFGLEVGQNAIPQGLLLAVPVAVTGWLTLWTIGVDVPDLFLGRLAFVSGGTVDLILQVLIVVVLFAGPLLLYAFLTVRSRDAWRETPMSQVEAIRTFGIGAVGVALVLGLLYSIRPGVRPAGVLWTVLGLLVLVLLTDRFVVPGETTSRATILGPAIVALLLRLFDSGGIIGGDLLAGLYYGSVAGGVAIVVATLLETRRYAWATLPIMAAAALYTSPLQL